MPAIRGDDRPNIADGRVPDEPRSLHDRYVAARVKYAARNVGVRLITVFDQAFGERRRNAAQPIERPARAQPVL